MPDIGDIYTAIIYFKGHSRNFKVRPVLVLNDLNNGWYTIAEITSISPKNPPGYYDLYKEPILNWQECGLNEPSFVKCKNIHNVEEIRLHNKIGTMNYNDFINIVDKILIY
ncbi:MAG: type II toxin-antitoxin system PemK/MazF family toxin [Clostridia bacterium]|nr:type II toxin-antitoxin system PemK/MazF family toxin [Clostridia bacterium]